MGKLRNTRKYPTYPEISESKKDTRKYPIVYFDTPTRPATRYFVQYPTRPDIEKLYPLGTGDEESKYCFKQNCSMLRGENLDCKLSGFSFGNTPLTI